MNRIPSLARLLAAGALTVFVYASPAHGSRGDETAPRPGADAPKTEAEVCSNQHSSLRQKATMILGLPPDADLRDSKKMKELITSYCLRNIDAPANQVERRNGREHGICEHTYVQILALINAADVKAKEACEAMRTAKEDEAKCNNGRACLDAAAKKNRAGAKMLRDSIATNEKGERILKKQIERHKKVALQYGEHLEAIAKAIRETEAVERQCIALGAAVCTPLTALQKQERINQVTREILNKGIKSVEGNIDVYQLLSLLKLSDDPAEISRRSREIKVATEQAEAGTLRQGAADALGPFAGEQVNAMRVAGLGSDLTVQANKSLSNGATIFENNAARIEQRIATAGTIPVDQRVATQAPLPGGRVVTDPVPQQVASVAPTAFSPGMPFNSSSASVAPSAAGGAPAAQAETVKQVSAQAFGGSRVLAAARTGRGLGMAPGEGEKLASAVGRELSEKERALDEIRQAPQFADELAEQAPAVAMDSPAAPSRIPAPGSETGASRGAAYGRSIGGGHAGPAGRAPASQEKSPGSADDPNAQAYADRQLQRMEQGRSFSPSLRDMLKKHLAADYAKGSGNAKAAAALFEEMRRSGGDPEAEAGAVAAGEDQQMGILSSGSESLFDRVRSCHRRSVAKAKLSFF